MSSPAERHRARILGQRETAAATAAVPTGAPDVPVPGAPAGSEYALLRASLGVDLRRLKGIQSTEKKIALKRDLIPAYDDWIAGVLAADAAGDGGAQDDIVTHIMIWRIDTGDYEGALPLADYVLRHKLTLPERFNRTAATLIAEETAEAALAALGQEQPFDLAILQLVDGMTEVEDMPDQARAKLEKAIGLVAARAADAIEPDADGAAGAKRAMLELALAALRRALQLDRNVGVKKELQRLERVIRDLTPPQVSGEA